MKFIFIAVFICILKLLGCCNSNEASEIVIADTTIRPINSFNNIFLDSLQLSTFLKEHSFYKNFSTELFDFYKLRNYQYAWFD